MAPRIGYLLPTREAVMQGRPETGPLLALAERAEALGYDAVWVGDSLLARPRHDPLTLLAAVAARTRKVLVGTAVFLPALRNPVVLAISWRPSTGSAKAGSCSAPASPPTSPTCAPNLPPSGCRSRGASGG